MLDLTPKRHFQSRIFKKVHKMPRRCQISYQNISSEVWILNQSGKKWQKGVIFATLTLFLSAKCHTKAWILRKLRKSTFWYRNFIHICQHATIYSMQNMIDSLFYPLEKSHQAFSIDFASRETIKLSKLCKIKKKCVNKRSLPRCELNAEVWIW